jgi:hypothetical protein
MVPLTEAEIENLRTLRRNGMTVRDIEAKCKVSRQTVQKYTSSLHDKRLGHGYKAPSAPRFTVERTMPNGTRRSVTADTREQAEKVCNWQLVGHVAAKIVAKAGNNRLGPKAEHGTKRTGREGVGSTDPALTETSYEGAT